MDAVVLAGNVVAALAFAALHLPQAIALFGSLTMSTLLVSLVGNGAVGILCGQLFWKRGLGYAVATHLGADLVLHVLFTT